MQALQQYRRLRNDDESDYDTFFFSYYSTPAFAWWHSAIGENTDLLSCILQIATDSDRTLLASQKKMGAACEYHGVAMLSSISATISPVDTYGAEATSSV